MSGHKRETPPKILRLVPDTIVFYNTSSQKLIKKNGKDCEPSSLAAMQSSTDRYLREPNYEYSILNILY